MWYYQNLIYKWLEMYKKLQVIFENVWISYSAKDLPLIWPKMKQIAEIAKPDATAVAKTESPLPETAEDAAAPDTTRLKRKVAKHSTATALQSSKLRASIDIGAFFSVSSMLFSFREEILVSKVTMWPSNSLENVSVVIFPT